MAVHLEHLLVMVNGTKDPHAALVEWLATAVNEPQRFIKSGRKKAQKQILDGWIGIGG
jgi:hypothetical protein